MRFSYYWSVMLSVLAISVVGSAQQSSGFDFGRAAQERAVIGTEQTCDAMDSGPAVVVNDTVRRALTAAGNAHPEFTHFVNVRCRTAHGPSYANVFFSSGAAASAFATRLATPGAVRLRIFAAASTMAFTVLAE